MSTVASDEIIKQYRKVIDALIPYQQQNKLLEGLNKFSGRLAPKVRTVIKEEVLRLTSLTDASADNSDFAAFPVKRFSHFGIDMKLDKVGRDILLKETAKYFDRYTVGVFEKVMSSDHYQSRIREAQQKKIVEAFTIQAQSFEDINFENDLAIRPNFSVTCLAFEKGKSCPITALASRYLTVETKRMPSEESEDGIYTFTFPEVRGLCKAGEQLFTQKVKGEFNQASRRFETTFKFVKPTPVAFIDKLSEYIKSNVNKVPLQRELEVERVLQDLDRDHILANSPWIPLFITEKSNEVKLSAALMSLVNFEYNQGFCTLEEIPSEKRLSRLMPELKKFGETFVLRGQFTTKKGIITVAASFRELQITKLLAPFIKLVMQTGNYSVLHYRLTPITEAPKRIAYDIHDMARTDYPELDAITHVIFCKNLTPLIGQLAVPEDTPKAKFPTAIIDDGERPQFQVIMEPNLDRRSEPRYQMNKDATVKLGMFSSFKATLNDLSTSGLRLTLHEPQEASIEKEVKVSVPELKLRNEKYTVIGFDKETGVLRLALHKNDNATADNLQSVLKTNASYFKTRDIALRQQNIYRFLWDLSIRHIPCVAILVTQNRHLLSRLRTVYADFNPRDLYPFKPANNEAMLHGLLADKGAEKPQSTVLKNMLSEAKQDVHVVHALRYKDKRIIYVNAEEFFYGDVRSQMCQFVAEKQVEACVTQLCAMRCRSETTPLTKKRLAQISKIDMELYEKLKEIQKVYTHILYIANISALHNSLLAAGVRPIAPQESDTEDAP